MDYLPESVQNYFKGVEQRALDYAYQKVKHSSEFLEKSKQIKNLINIVKILVVVVVIVILYLIFKK